MGQSRSVVVLVAVFSAAAACTRAPIDVPEAAAVAPAPETVPQEATPMDRRTLARHGLSLLDQKLYAEAVPVLTEAAAQYPEVAPFLRLRILEAEVGRENFAEAARIGTEIVALGDTS